MISVKQIKFLKSLNNKRNRVEAKSFLVEGEKMALEAINSNYKIKNIYALKEWLIENKSVLFSINCIEVSNNELSRISQFTTPNKVIVELEINNNNYSFEEILNDTFLVLDTVQDPGNLGTIIRTADWYGIKNIICSNNTVEKYNNKVVQASMGSIFRVNCYYCDIENLLKELKSINYPIYGALLNGQNINKVELRKKSAIIMGNESNGISELYIPYINNPIRIPSYPENNNEVESLNVSIATAIICSKFRENSNL